MSKSYSRSKVADYAVSSISEGSDAKKLAHQLAAYLVESGRTDDVNSLARDILQLRADKSGIVEVTAIVSHELDSSSRDQIEKTVRAVQPNTKKVIINQQIDSSAIGGIRLEFANALLDSTVDARLAALREKTRV